MEIKIPGPIEREIRRALEIMKIPVTAGVIIIIGGKLMGFDTHSLETSAIVVALTTLVSEMKSRGEI